MDLAGFTGLILLVLVILFVVLFFNFIPVGLWISAWAAGVKVPIWTLVGMRLRRVPPPSHRDAAHQGGKGRHGRVHRQA